MQEVTPRRQELKRRLYRGNDRDRWKFLGYLAEGAERYWVKVYCYVLMENHFHLVVMTPEGNLSQWIHQLKTAYTVYFNRRHQVVGHLFQGRFKSTVIEAEKYLLEVSRYLHLNPVRGVVLGCGVIPHAQQQFGGSDDSANQGPRRPNSESFKESNKS